MKYLNETILCLEGFEFIKTEKNPAGLIPKGTYDSLRAKSKIVCHGRGGNGSQVLIEFESLPEMYKSLVKEKLCNGADPYEYIAKEPIRQLIKADIKAIQFFDAYRKPDGFPLKPQRRIQYANNSAILNALNELLSDKKRIKKDFKITMDKFWKTACDIVKEVSDKLPNTLPTSDRRLKECFKDYKDNGYASVISGKVGNDNRRKVDDELERLLLSIYTNGKPYAKEVKETFERFMNGEVEIFCEQSGELFTKEQFYKNGEPIELSDTTVWSYINNPGNRITVDKFRTGKKEFNDTHRPHHHRHSPVWAFSKTTMDDLEIPFKMPNGERVKSYQIADVTSGCIVGKAFGTDKNRGLFLDAVVDMFRLIVNKGWGIPAEMEVEHHIANTFTDDLLKPGNVFPFVRFCAPANPQEKRAEHIFRHKKYSLQKQRPGFQGRWFGKQEATRPNEDKSKRVSYEDIVANELTDINKWNNSPHPNQVMYPGMTRWQVLCEMQNPQLVTPDLGLISRFIGMKTPTSINRSQYVQVKYAKYSLPNAEVLDMLQANNYNVDAYYVPDADGLIREVHLYQNEQYICTCKKLTTYNESKAEQTDNDLSIRTAQKDYVTAFDARVKDRASKLAKVKIQEASESFNNIEVEIIPNTPIKKEPTDTESYQTNDDAEYWSKKALEDV